MIETSVNASQIFVRTDQFTFSKDDIFNHFISPLISRIDKLPKDFVYKNISGLMSKKDSIDHILELISNISLKKEYQNIITSLDKNLLNELKYLSEYLRKSLELYDKYLILHYKIKHNLSKISNELNTNLNDFFDDILTKLDCIHVMTEHQYIGANVSLSVNNQSKHYLPTDYASLENIETIEKVSFSLPCTFNSKSNTRSGFFSEIQSQFNLKHLNTTEFFHIPLKIGKLLMHVYCHKKYLHHGLSLFKLFSPSTDDLSNNETSISAILIFGVKEKKFDSSYYFDKKNDLFLGTIYDTNKNDYFGYMKKMLLTLHNLYYIKKEALPIHGAMVTVKLLNNSVKNIIIIGDSGAGKSETLEAFRLIGDSMIKEMKIVFDDMGIITYNQKTNNFLAYGTETGAFVRIDDLENKFVFENINNSILLNPNKINARLLINVTDYNTVIKGTEIDIILYANNYDNVNNPIKIFSDKSEAVKVFSEGKRLAKGTTSELGMAKNFFANPFGPVQEEKKVQILMNRYFEQFFNNKIILGEIYTKLAIDGYEMEGPRKAAESLLNLLKDQ